MRLNQTYLFLILFLSASSFASSCYSTEKSDTLKVLFVGNSYTYVQNLPQVISILSDGTKTKLVTRKSTVGGAFLSEHWYSKRGLATRELISKGKYDIVVIQENSMGAILQPDSTQKYARLLCSIVKASGAKPYIYMTWAREKVPQYQEEIASVFSRIARENGAVLVPVGKAWELARKLRPAIGLYDADGSHPSGLGAVLSACIFTGALTGEIPRKLPGGFSIKDSDGESVQLMNIDSLDAIFIRKVTEQTLKDYGLLK